MSLPKPIVFIPHETLADVVVAYIPGHAHDVKTTLDGLGAVGVYANTDDRHVDINLSNGKNREILQQHPDKFQLIERLPKLSFHKCADWGQHGATSHAVQAPLANEADYKLCSKLLTDAGCSVTHYIGHGPENPTQWGISVQWDKAAQGLLHKLPGVTLPEDLVASLPSGPVHARVTAAAVEKVGPKNSGRTLGGDPNADALTGPLD